MYKLQNELMLKEFNGKGEGFSPEVLSAIKNVNREVFIPDALRHKAFSVDALPLGSEQWISSPLTVAKMSNYLMGYDVKEALQKPDNVLEIGLGSGYQACVLSKLIRRVFSIERIESLYNEARARIAKLNIMNVNIKLDDGSLGWASFAPFDRILLSACASSVPQTLFSQLAVGGILVAPLQKGKKQVISRFVKKDFGIKEEELETCEFVPLLSGIAKSL
ncbi:protein-L-isoaspartate(D-aspartate) O-methyltransferase [Helicobacter sp. 11S02629-2]|uniref:protein-L-isoaspartate(D-aspartate) O-methyltransferase n=1 Tax=Helicobacter sp. 11S02629-2 TaxID=1476195 RepID=UPI000BA67F38|nr:protein-L-isoaspartate(D-aspartate) O-methyltransferase [Helicobacter sp. 11S02629-2]PAF45919.1 protein-L-isoaspartate O-methyltransferase [Helicobacter sp. 11S02629-2]